MKQVKPYISLPSSGSIVAVITVVGRTRLVFRCSFAASGS